MQSVESERNLPVLLVRELLNSSTPSAGSLWMKWRSSRGSRWRKICKKPARSLRVKWRMPTMSTRPTCSAKVTIEIFRSNEFAGFQCPRLICLTLCFRSSEATGGTATHGGVAQSRNAKEEGDAAQVFMSSVCLCMNTLNPICQWLC